MKIAEDSRLLAIAAELAAAIINPGDGRELKVTLSFGARRSGTGLEIGRITLGYDEKKGRQK